MESSVRLAPLRAAPHDGPGRPSIAFQKPYVPSGPGATDHLEPPFAEAPGHGNGMAAQVRRVFLQGGIVGEELVDGLGVLAAGDHGVEAGFLFADVGRTSRGSPSHLTSRGPGSSGSRTRYCSSTHRPTG
jgi:hypothetical protein